MSTPMTMQTWKTPMREANKTPRVHRLLASARPKTPLGNCSTYKYEDLLGKQWRAHSLSPLYQFKTTPASLTRYARSLDMAISKRCSSDGYESGEVSVNCTFEKYHGLSFHTDDPDSIRIQVTDSEDELKRVVFTAMLTCVDIEDPCLVDQSISKRFTFFPLLLVSGTKSRANILIDWLQTHFDCRSSPVEFSDSDLEWMLAFGCHQQGVKKHPVLLQYDVRSICDGINTIDCMFESSHCHNIWNESQKENTSAEVLTEAQVSDFISTLEAHLEYSMHIMFKKLHLNEVGTPLVYVAKDGKLKIFDPKGVYVILHMICEINTEKMVRGATGMFA